MKPKEEWGEESTEKEGEGEKREAARWVPLPPSSPLLAEGKGDLGEHEERERELAKQGEEGSVRAVTTRLLSHAIAALSLKP